MKGKIISVTPEIRQGRLKITCGIQTGENQLLRAYLPARETAALLPRSILLGTSKKVPEKLLETIQPILCRLIVGRTARIWEYDKQYYFRFQSWNEVIFEAAAAGNGTSTASESRRPQLH